MDPGVEAAIISAAVGGVAVIIAAAISMITTLRERAKAVKDNERRDQKNAERQAEIESQLAALNAKIKRDADEETAKRDYTYDALKRLYSDVNPLLFQLREYCDGSAWRTRRIICGEIQVDDGRHLMTSSQRVCAPLVVAQELQRHLTAVDLRVDPVIRAQYIVSRELLWTLHAGKAIAHIEPRIIYPEDPRQHLTFAQLQRLVDALTVKDPDGSRRPMKQFELEDAWHDKDPRITKTLKSFERLFSGATPTSKPVLWRLLFAHAYFMHVYVDLVDRNSGEPGSLVPIDTESFRWPGADEDLFTSQRAAAETFVRTQLTAAGLL
jgi:hypothetical protein